MKKSDISINLDNFSEHEGVINSPRSLEACLRQGIDPVDLRSRPIEFFIRKGESKQASMLKHEHFEHKRKERLKIVRRERNMIIEYLSSMNGARSPGGKGQSPKGNSPSPTKMKFGTLGISSPGFKDGSSTSSDKISSTLEAERKRLETVKKRQAAEIQQMMEYEIKQQERVEENARRQAAERERQRQRKKELEQRKQQAIEKKRQMALQRKQAEDEAERKRQEVARQAFLKEKKLKAEREKKDRQRKLEARQREVDRQKKQEAFRAQTAALIKAQEDEAYRKMLKMQADEEARLKRLAEKRRKDNLARKRASRKANARIKAALEANDKMLRQREIDYEIKEKLTSERNAEKKRQKNEERRQMLQKRREEEERRRNAFLSAKQNESDRTSGLLARFNAHEDRMREIADQKALELELKKTKENLLKQDKLENIARMKRIDEFVRLQTLRKIESDDKRAKNLKIQKQKLLQERKKASQAARMRKYRLNQAMAKVRTNGKWSEISFGNILDDSGSPASTRKKKKKKKRGKHATSLPNLGAAASP